MKHVWLVGLLALGAAPALSQDRLTDRPAIVVIGRGQAEAPPDRFRIQADVEGRGRTQVEALRGLSDLHQALARDVGRLDGLEHSRVTSSNPNVSPVFDPACATERNYDRQNCPVSGYVARMGVTLEGGPADRAGAAVSLAAERGALNTRLEATFLSSDRDLNAQARQAAFADARRQAGALAEVSGQRLGRILRIQEPQSSSPSPPPPPPPPARPEVVVTGARIQPSVPLDFTPPPVRANAALTVVFEIE